MLYEVIIYLEAGMTLKSFTYILWYTVNNLYLCMFTAHSGHFDLLIILVNDYFNNSKLLGSILLLLCLYMYM